MIPSNKSIWTTMVTPRWAAFLFAVGLVLRLLCGFLQGTQDMEWWKIWGRESVHHGLTRMYGPTDEEVLQRWKEGATLREVHAACGKQVRAGGYPVNYGREFFPVVQPPVYLFALHGATKLYAIFQPELPNTRWFNFAINAITLLASMAISLVIFRFTLPVSGRETAMGATLLFWLNPLVMVNAPIQGYLDQLAALFAMLSVTALATRKIVWSWVFLTVAVLTKPQAVLVAPVIFVAGLLTLDFKSNLVAWLSAGSVAALLCSPWAFDGRILGIPVALSQVAQYPDAITVQALNAWWPVNYALDVSSQVAGGSPFLRAFFGPGLSKLDGHTHTELAQWLGVNFAAVGLIAFAGLSMLILVLWFRNLRSKSSAGVAFIAGMIVFSYFLFAKAVHTNHYFLMIPFFALYVAVEARLRIWFGLIVVSFLAQDLLFFGLGRDFNVLRWKLDRFWLLWLTNLLSFANLTLFFYGLAHLLGRSHTCDIDKLASREVPAPSSRRPISDAST